MACVVVALFHLVDNISRLKNNRKWKCLRGCEFCGCMRGVDFVISLYKVTPSMALNLFKRRDKDDATVQFQILNRQICDATDLIANLQKKDGQFALSDQLAQTPLGESLQSLKAHLDEVARQEGQRNWTNNGLASFSDILRNKQSLDFERLTNEILSQLIRYLGVNQGAIFIIDETNEKDAYLKLEACYAYDRKKHVTKRVEIGEGLVGQCVLEKQPNYITQIPKDYIHITSGLGEAAPSSVFISPLIINDQVFGVIEIASFQPLELYKQEFITKLSENIAATIKTVKENDRNVLLLKSSQQQAEELKAQEEELRQNMEELEATQEEMRRKSVQLAATMAEIQSLVRGINETMATIEFSPDGTVLTANAKFLETMKYDLARITGKHHRMFVPEDVLSTPDYATFWKRLAAGQSISGIFRRRAANGATIWLNAIYNPIFSESGEVLKVIKLANDITAEQELMAENKAVLAGIDASMAVIEFSPEGIVQRANENFLQAMGYRLDQIKGAHHRKFMPAEKTGTAEYQQFWARLADGKAVKGVFERVSSSGTTVILNAIYNPILNAEGKVTKIVKFATNLTHHLRAGQAE